MTPVRRKLLVVGSSLGEGGAQRVTSTLLQHLSRDALDIALCLFKPVIDFPVPDDVAVTTLFDRDVSIGAEPWLIPTALVRLRRALGEHRPDVVLSVIDQVNLLVAVALRSLRVPVRWIARVGTNPDYQGTAQRLAAGRAYRRADRVIANAAGLARALAALYPRVADRITHLANPTDFARIDALAALPPSHARDRHGGDPPRSLIVAVGRLVPEKRPDLLVEAAAALKPRRRFELWICGDGPLTGRVERQIRVRGLQDQVRLLGFCRNPYAILAQADAFVMTSDIEGLPNGLIEAQGLGVPAVATDCPHGPGEIILHGETGFLAPVGDSGAVAEALDKLLSDDARRAEMGRVAAQRTRARYSVESLMATWDQLVTGRLP